jgi:hypothetical protein
MINRAAGPPGKETGPEGFSRNGIQQPPFACPSSSNRGPSLRRRGAAALHRAMLQPDFIDQFQRGLGNAFAGKRRAGDVFPNRTGGRDLLDDSFDAYQGNFADFPSGDFFGDLCGRSRAWRKWRVAGGELDDDSNTLLLCPHSDLRAVAPHLSVSNLRCLEQSLDLLFDKLAVDVADYHTPAYKNMAT